MRRVQVFKYERDSVSGKHNRVPDAVGTFIQYGCDYREFDEGPANFSTAIIEMDDRTVRNIPLHDIQFLNMEATETGTKACCTKIRERITQQKPNHRLSGKSL